MIRHIVYRNQLLFLTRDDAGDVFLKLVIVFRLDETLPAFDGEHDMEIDLRVGICHTPKMPLLAELENLYLAWFYRDFAPMALPVTSSIPQVIRERAFVRHERAKDAGEFRACGGKIRELEHAPFLETNQKDAFAVLRHDAAGVNDVPPCCRRKPAPFQPKV